MKKLFILMDIKTNQFVSDICWKVTSTSDNKNDAILFTETQEWINGYIFAIQSLTGHQYKSVQL